MKSYFMLCVLGLFSLLVSAQNPSWEVNTSNYQYSMTFTSFLNVNGTTLSSSEDKVAAFVNGEIRGVANVTYVKSVNKYVAYLSVYANTNNETINFKIYNSQTNEIVIVSETQSFKIDGNVGGIFQSYSIAKPILNNQTVLNSFTFSGVNHISYTISNNKINIVLPSNTDLANLVAEFSISSGASFFVDNLNQVSGSSVNNFTSTVNYKLLSENEAELVSYDVNVTLEISNTDVPVLELNSVVSGSIKQAPVVINMKTNVAIYGFLLEDVLLTNAVVLSINKINNFNYTIHIAPIQQGLFSIEIPENVVLNNENEGNSMSNKLNFTYDVINPYILSVKRKEPLNEITTSNTLIFTVTFNEDVYNVSATDFESAANAVHSVTKETQSTYVITIHNLANTNLSVSLNIKQINSIQDFAGNLLINSVIKANQN